MEQAVDRAAQIQRGEISFPLCCGHCMSRSVLQQWRPSGETAGGVIRYREVLACLACSRETTLETAHTIRRQQMVAFLREGEHTHTKEA